MSPEISGLSGNLYRTFGASLSFVIFIPFASIGLVRNFKSLTRSEKGTALVASCLALFLISFVYGGNKMGKTCGCKLNRTDRPLSIHHL